MPAAYPLLNIPYPLGHIKLGALIPNIKQPSQDARNPTRPIIEGTDFRFRDQDNFKFVYDLSEKSSIRARITRLFSFGRKHAESENLLLESTQGRIYELEQPRDFYLELCRDATIRNWLINCVKDGDEPYFITALNTFTNTTLVNKAELERILSIEVEVPAGTAATLMGGVPGAAVLDSSAGGDSGQKISGNEKSEVHGERIFAISVRKVCFKWFSQDELKGARIEKDNRWIYTLKREGGPPQVKDVVETDLEEADPEFDGVSELVAGADGTVRLQIIEP